MNIEIRTNPEKRNILTICVDDEEWKEVHSSIWKKIKFSFCESFEQLDLQFAEIEYRLAKNYVLRRLASKSYPSQEIQKKLTEKLISLVTIHRIIEECQTMGYLNDSQWIDAFVQQQITKKNGPQVIYQKLVAKGIESSFAKQMMGQTNELQKESIRQLLATKYRNRNLNERRDRQNVITALLRKGFSFDVIREAFQIE